MCVCVCAHTQKSVAVLFICTLCSISTLHHITHRHACAQCTFWMKLKGKHDIVPCPYLFILCHTGLFGGIPFTPGRRSYKV